MTDLKQIYSPGSASSKAIVVLLPLIFCSDFNANAQAPAEKKITLLFIGDIMGHEEQIWSAENRSTHTFSYDTVFSFIKPEIEEADIAIANLEAPLGGRPYSGYPAFSSPDALAVACKNAGIDCLVTANNHSADRKEDGILHTLHVLDSLGIPHTGTFSDQAEREALNPLIIEKNGFTLALLNYTYGTNGISVKNPVTVNKIEKSVIEKDLEAARQKNPDIITVFIHWGTEYDTTPSSRQYETETFLLEKGADLVIGSHPHVMQKMIWEKNTENGCGRVTVFSLGNFVSNQRKRHTDGGAIARIEITKRNGSALITDADYYLTWVYTPIVNFRKNFFILPCSKFENKASFFTDTAQYKMMKSFINDSRLMLYKQNVNFNEMIYNGSSWLLFH